MEGHTSFGSLVIVVIVAFLMPIILNRFRLHFVPGVVAEIIAGIIIGETGFNLVHQGAVLETLSTLGFIYLLFLSGLEIDFSVFASERLGAKDGKKGPNGLILSLLMFVFILATSFVLALLIGWLGFSHNPFLMALIIATISLGIVVPTLKDSGILKASIGQNILLITVIGDLVTMILLAVFVSLNSKESGSTWLLLILAAAGVVLFFLGKFFKHRTFMETLTKGTVQLDIRAVFALIIVLVGLAQSIGTEIILGSFLAGVLVSLLSPNPGMVSKLDSFGYGFLIPIFFVMVGVKLNLREIFTDPQVLALIPMLIIAFFLAKLIPSLLLKRWYNWRTTLSVGFLISAKLTLVIAAAQMGERLGLISDKMASAIILVGVLSCIVGPIVFKKLFPFSETVSRKKVVFIGANRLTLPLSLELDSERFETKIYHTDMDKAETDAETDFEVKEIPDYHVETLKQTHAYGADVLVIATGKDDINAEIAEAALDEKVDRIICRAETPKLVEGLRAKGIEVFSSFFSAKTMLKAMIQSPGMVDLLTTKENGLYQIDMANADYSGVPLRRFPFLGDLIIVRIFRGGESMIPHGDTELEVGDRLIVTGGKEHVDLLTDRLS
ncbi:monovalent cation:proton antiporter family protein [Camelliibacillus cellulosilyticus]|uniref:Monovalent cation:proton antiporter family protein n=1 Tax=Camelliibacillus cellulosilyticus TaxID=2174486 RepID=A0ABV9GQ68_9BACL